ncbi:hypothetical protein ACWGH2_25220 [Streptomyces sp. NPDC054871]
MPDLAVERRDVVTGHRGAFVERHARPGGTSPFTHETPPTPEELTEWRLWVTTVFLPNIQAMRDLVIKHADLLSEPEMGAVRFE